MTNRHIRSLLVALCLLPAVAQAQTMMSCAQNDNFACLGTAEDVTGPWNFLGAAPMSFEGATNDANETTVSVTDPTADRTMVIPNANSAVPTNTGLPCSAGQHISDFNVGTGVFTCSADSGGGTTDSITVNGTAATDANFVSNSKITFSINTAPSPDDISATITTDAIGSGELSSTAIQPGDLGNVFAVGTCDGTNPSATSCTLAAAPASPAHLWMFNRGVFMRVISTSPGVNEVQYTTGTTATFTATQALGTGANAAFYFMVR